MKITKRMKAALFAICFSAAGIFGAAYSTHAASISSESQASAKALEKVPGAAVTDVERDRDNGVVVYDVELVKGNKKYEIVYRASDAKILEYSWEKIAVSPNTNKSIISESKCRSLAQKKVKNGEILSIVLKYDDGINYYKVKMTGGKKTYTLKFHARTGALIDYEWKYTSTASSNGNGNGNGNGNSSDGYIGMDKAKQIAKNKVPGGTIVKAEFDMDDGVPVYEIELVKGNREYECKIHARTGQILKYDVDYDD